MVSRFFSSCPYALFQVPGLPLETWINFKILSLMEFAPRGLRPALTWPEITPEKKIFPANDILPRQ
jgi:hypothetical protein